MPVYYAVYVPLIIDLLSIPIINDICRYLCIHKYIIQINKIISHIISVYFV